jgi:hypothetical protein
VGSAGDSLAPFSLIQEYQMGVKSRPPRRYIGEQFTVEIYQDHCITTNDELRELVPVCHHAELRFGTGYYLPFVFVTRYGEQPDWQITALCFECQFEATQLVRRYEGDLD